MEERAPPPDPIEEGIRLFNEGYYFEAHEVWEDAWHVERGEPRLFLQGLIQVAAGCHHLKNGNRAGAIALFRKALDKLGRYPPEYIRIEAGRLAADVALLRDSLAQGAEPFSPVFPTIVRTGRG